jgi:CheY-like chemotaxis protein
VEGDAERCLAAGMNGYISKPVQLADLIAAICRVTATGAGSP